MLFSHQFCNFLRLSLHELAGLVKDEWFKVSKLHIEALLDLAHFPVKYSFHLFIVDYITRLT